ncbi:MAG: hypothetical protein ABJC24_10305 [Chloroflexota bacterium]
MRHRAAVASTAAVILSLAFAATTLAGGWANAIMDSPPDDPGGPNQPITIGFTLLQHGVAPVDWGTAQVVLTNEATGQSVTVDAAPQGKVGHWVAEISVPAEGTWSYEVRHDLEISMVGFNPIVIGEAAAAPAAAAAASTAASVQPALLLAGAFLGLLALAGMTAGIIALRHGRMDRARA